ncbi:2Fe-2S iron-sulfur cluster-binding protein [Sulfurimonas sp.]|uniref:succinate dehydrogenase/fumarate reductase iron-sulfur subunit n=1 Tax=Sulfurimonas sp. TaxID=2022749 RepID=UPI0025FB6EE7|nr:2Fe-2S iron-sulfur cluster-binding protein [Sulfurimonas sp.]
MKIKIQRESIVEYEVDIQDSTLLNILQMIKITQDATLTYSSGCKSSVCGSCSMRVNGREILACVYKVQDGDFIQPLKNVPIIRDLVVDMDKALSFNEKAKAWLHTLNPSITLSKENEKINEIQSNCILCGACYSACPVYAVNEEFIGPFSLTRVWRYVSDVREQNANEKIEVIQTSGIWDCTLCNECTLVCPQDISSKADIEKLRSKSAILGYSDPNFAASFGGGFGTSIDGSPSF